MKVIAFGASTSSTSINKQLATYAASLLTEHECEILDLRDYDMPIYSEDLEKDPGIPQAAYDFMDKINGADALIISFAEHNGSYSAAYKNIFDWVSRIKAKVYEGKQVVLLATSPGPGGAKSVLTAAAGSMGYFGAEVHAQLSIPQFGENFDAEQGKLINDELDQALHDALAKLD